MRQNKKGFTLVEIIVVVVILAVLMAVAVPSVLRYVDAADDAKIYTVARTYMNDLQYATTKELANLQEGETWETFEKNVVKHLVDKDFYTQRFGLADGIGITVGGIPNFPKVNGFCIIHITYTAINNEGNTLISYNDLGNKPDKINDSIDLSKGINFTEYNFFITEDQKIFYLVKCVPNGKIEILDKIVY